MASTPGVSDPTRILSIVIHPRYSAHASVDRFGLAEDRPPVWDLRRHRSDEARAERLRHLVRRAVTRWRPAITVIAVAHRDVARCRPLVEAARTAAGGTGYLAAGDIAQARRLFLGTSRGSCGGAFKTEIVRGFFPQLSAWRGGGGDRLRYRRNRWYAIGLALVELARRFPRAAFALAQADVGRFGEFIARCERAARSAAGTPPEGEGSGGEGGL